MNTASNICPKCGWIKESDGYYYPLKGDYILYKPCNSCGRPEMDIARIPVPDTLTINSLKEDLEEAINTLYHDDKSYRIYIAEKLDDKWTLK